MRLMYLTCLYKKDPVKADMLSILWLVSETQYQSTSSQWKISHTPTNTEWYADTPGSHHPKSSCVGCWNDRSTWEKCLLAIPRMTTTVEGGAALVISRVSNVFTVPGSCKPTEHLCINRAFQCWRSTGSVCVGVCVLADERMLTSVTRESLVP